MCCCLGNVVDLSKLNKVKKHWVCAALLRLPAAPRDTAMQLLIRVIGWGKSVDQVVSWGRLKLSPSAMLELHDQGKSSSTFFFLLLFFFSRLNSLICDHGAIQEALGAFMILLDLRKFQSFLCSFYFWRSKVHLYFTEHHFLAGQILLFPLLLWVKPK